MGASLITWEYINVLIKAITKLVENADGYITEKRQILNAQYPTVKPIRRTGD